MSQAVIADVVAPRERGRYQGYMAGTWGVACVFGPILGGWMTDHLSWHWIFWINVPIGIAAMLLSNRALKLLKTRRVPARIDYLGAALLTGFITACLLVMSWGGVDYPWGSPEVLGTAALAVLLLGALILQERRAIDPLLPPRLFANSVFNSGVAIAFLSAGGLFGATFLLPLFFQLVRGADAATSGSMIVPFLATSTVGAFASGQLARRLGRAKMIVLGGLGGSILGFGLLATMDAQSSTLLALIYMSVVGFGIGICMPSSLVIVQNAAERRDVGAATGALLFLRSMGSALGSTLVGSLVAIGFARNLAAAGVTQEIDLGALREAGGAALHLDQATAAIARAALASSFQLAFAACAVLSTLAFLVCLAMRDLPLQSSGKN
jgi:MFS family permease